ncbi:MAG: ABC transporter ATP-binding protein [Desulfobacterales bacterium]|jgi:ABC-type bacteriocin/lantibiotic exporter with double-glycine peptidase domain
MKTWFTYLKQGLSSQIPQDRIGKEGKHPDIIESLKNLLPYCKRHWRKGCLGFILIILGALCSLPAPLITRYLVDEVILNRQLGLLAGAAALLACFLVAEKLARMLQEFYFARLEQQVTLDVQQDLIARVLKFPKAFFDDHQSGYLMSRLTEDVDGIRWFFSNTLVHICSNAFRFVGGVCLLFYLEWRLAAAVLVLLPGLACCVHYFSNRLHHLYHRTMEQKAELGGNLQESLSESTLIKAYASERHTVKRLLTGWQQLFKTTLQQTTVASLASLIVDSTPGLARLLSLGVGAIWIIDDQWTLGSLLAFQAYLVYVFGPAQILASANLQLQKALAALQRVSALLRIVPEDNAGDGKLVAKLSGDVEFRGVSFAYTGSEPVLQNFSFFVRAGQRVAIVGPNGVGKTTLLSLILGFYQPTQGEIYFDNQPASGYDVCALRKRIGYVAQQPRLLSGTILNNLRYGNPEASQAQVVQVAKAAGIHRFIKDLPQGYQTHIGEKGVNLSEGQKQRLSIARALIKNPDILILDEPTASLDFEAEQSLYERLPEFIRQKTLFIATHRLSTINACDRVLVLDENRLVTSGSHQDLFETNDYYRKIFANAPILNAGLAN